MLDPDAPEVVTYVWVANVNVDLLDDLQLSVADGRAHLVVANVDLDWMYHPYGGGADVIAPTSSERDVFRDRHADWLPNNPRAI